MTTTSARARLSAALTGLGCAVGIAVLAPAAAGAAAPVGPDFGPNVTIFTPRSTTTEINAYLRSISSETEFGQGRHAVYFAPGTYGSASGQNNPATATGTVNAEVGYYTTIAGLGTSPTDVTINGALHSEPRQGTDGTSDGLTNFYRSLANLSINPIQAPVGADAARARPEGVASPHTMRWATSQASSLRRVDVRGSLDLNGAYGATLFGATIADSLISGNVNSGGTGGPGQAQYFVQDSQIGGWTGGSANLVFSGVAGAPATDFAGRGITTSATTPTSRPAPFLALDGSTFEVVVPAVRRSSAGPTWSEDVARGTTLPISSFYIAKPGDSAATINAALASGKNLIVTPGVYLLSAPLQVTRPDTVVMGMGYATLTAPDGKAAIQIGDVRGVVVSGLVVDSGRTSNTVIAVGTGAQPNVGDAADPTTLSDIAVRVGGAHAGSATTLVQIDQSNVVLDNTWLWRADHGTGVGWDENTSEHGLVVNGHDVTALGLFVEHNQKEQTVWNGERGTTIFYQSELPYDPPNQAAWMDGTAEGYASYVVSPTASVHTLVGAAVYSLFTASTFAGAPVHAWTAIEAPSATTVRLTSLTTAVIALGGGIRGIVNGVGGTVDASAPNDVVPGFLAAARLASSAGR